MELKNLTTKYLARKFDYYKTIDSTQDEIWRRIENGDITNGEIVFSELQTNSYGTHGRIWHTDEIGDIAFSLLIKTNCNVEKLDGMTFEMAKIFEKIFKEYGIDIQIKLPNDIYLNGKKLGGILCQTKLVGETVKYIVVGIGVNINKMNFSDDIKEIATSVKKEFPNIEIDRLDVVSKFCNIFEDKLNKRIGEE